MTQDYQGPQAPQPPDELVQEWRDALWAEGVPTTPISRELANRAAAWGWEQAMTTLAELLAQRHPAPVPVSERPWERDGWCDELGRCWLLLCPDDGFHLPNWKLDRPSHHELPNGAVSLPAHALPLPTEDRT